MTHWSDYFCMADTSLILLFSPRTYNVQAVSFTPAELVAEMRKYYPNMEVTYEPDERQAIGKEPPACK